MPEWSAAPLELTRTEVLKVNNGSEAVVWLAGDSPVIRVVDETIRGPDGISCSN